MFLAGCLPGALPARSLRIGSYIISVKCNCPRGGERFNSVNFFKQLWVSVWALLAIVIVAGGYIPQSG